MVRRSASHAENVGSIPARVTSCLGGVRMIVYHGSNHKFSRLQIRTKLSSSASLENQGAGIYFSTNKDVACSYGEILYTLEVNQDYLIDFCIMSSVRSYLNRVRKEVYWKTRLDIAEYISCTQLSQWIVEGRISPVCICREISLLLDSEEKFHSLPISIVEKSGVILSKFDKTHQKVYLYPDTIPGVGVAKTASEKIIRIVDRERI